MKVFLELEVGEKTCYSETGKHCQMLGFKRLGTVPVCMIFNQIELQEHHVTGQIMRLDKCMQELKPCTKTTQTTKM